MNILVVYCIKCSFYTYFQDVRGLNSLENQAGESREKEGEGPDIVDDNVLSTSSKDDETNANKGGQESNDSDLDLSLYQIINIDQNTVSLAESSGVGFDEEVDVGDLNVGGKKQRKVKEKAKGKGRQQRGRIQYPFKNVFGSVGKYVRKVGRFNIFRGGFPLNYDNDLKNLTLFELLKVKHIHGRGDCG